MEVQINYFIATTSDKSSNFAVTYKSGCSITTTITTGYFNSASGYWFLGTLTNSGMVVRVMD